MNASSDRVPASITLACILSSFPWQPDGPPQPPSCQATSHFRCFPSPLPCFQIKGKGVTLKGYYTNSNNKFAGESTVMLNLQNKVWKSGGGGARQQKGAGVRGTRLSHPSSLEWGRWDQLCATQALFAGVRWGKFRATHALDLAKLCGRGCGAG
eukprot:363137-Chlamydomonas_euryale.AAC.9